LTVTCLHLTLYLSCCTPSNQTVKLIGFALCHTAMVSELPTNTAALWQSIEIAYNAVLTGLGVAMANSHIDSCYSLACKSTFIDLSTGHAARAVTAHH
jgi:hypothetical protein